MEYIQSSSLTLHIETNKRTIHRVFDNYAQLFEYGTMMLSDLGGGSELYTHTDEQWAARGELCVHYRDTDVAAREGK